MAKNCIGLDLGSSAVKLTQVKKGRGGFQLLNFGIERIWFTPPHRVTPNNTKLVPPLVGPRRRGHIIMGSIEGIVFIVGWFLVVAGFAVLGTRGYGSF